MNRLTKWLTLSIVIVILDQITKIMAENTLQLYERIAVTPFFNITLAYNEGAAFSFLSEAGGWQRWFFVGLTLVICTVLLFWLKKTDNKYEATGISLILAGAVGNNLIDRLFYGHVIDFLDVYYDTYHWPAFNVADMAISGGVMLLIFVTFTQPSDASKNK